MQCKQLILWTIAVLLITACNTPLSNRIDNYVNEVENNCSNWTEDDWERSQSEYEKLLEEYQTNYDSYSQEERDAINKAIIHCVDCKLFSIIKKIFINAPEPLQ